MSWSCFDEIRELDFLFSNESPAKVCVYSQRPASCPRRIVSWVADDGIVQFNSYQYLTVDGFGMDADGWYDGNYELVSSPIAQVGQGFWLILSDYANVTLTEKSPIAE